MFSLFDLLPRSVLQPEPVAASDGTLYRSAAWALLHDLVEVKWRNLLPTLCDGATIQETRDSLQISQAQLAAELGISQSLLSMIESGDRRISETLAERLWTALWRKHQERVTVPLGMELLIRLDQDLSAFTVTTVEQVKA